MKRPNLCLISVPECDGENESKLENTLQDIIRRTSPTSKAGQHSNPGNRDHHKDIPQEEPSQDTHILKIKGRRTIYQANGKQK